MSPITKHISTVYPLSQTLSHCSAAQHKTERRKQTKNDAFKLTVV